MPELPEIANLSKQMTRQLRGKRIANVHVTQLKCLNLPAKRFRRVIGRRVNETTARGKWLFTNLHPDTLLLNLGMGGDLIYHKNEATIPQKYQLLINFKDESALTASFFWFGYIHLVFEKELPKHKMTNSLGISALDKELTAERFECLLSGRRGAIKRFLLDQSNISGIGNVYVQDPLFKAKIHPLRLIPSLTSYEIQTLHKSIREVLNQSLRLGGLRYERNLYGRNGNYGPENFLVAYKTGKPCPACRTRIAKIRTGSTASYICPNCQKL
jgi:formamidopyrimidine-DNA glycosylase